MLAEAIFTKYQADGANSLLNSLDGQDWNLSGIKISPAQTKHDEADDFKRKSEEAYRERDLYLA